MTWLEARADNEKAGVVKEQDPRPSIGVAVLVVGIDETDPGGQPLIWTITENHTKDATDKKKGQLSSPAETKKEGENPQDTTLAALAEFTDSDADLDRLRVLAYMPKAISVKGNPVDVVVMHYDGSLSEPHASVDLNETTPNGWMKPGDLRRMNGELRPAIHSSLTVVTDEDLRILLASRSSDTVRDLVGPEFSLREFIKTREAGKPDVA